jgi:hypothetical protein
MLRFHNKKAVSIMIGYVLLIVGAVVMGGVVYGWLQSYVPQETLECPDGISLFIKDVTCISEGGKYKLNLSVSNNGRFDVDGYFIKSAEIDGQEIATTDISEKMTSGGNPNSGLVLFAGKALEPSKTAPLAMYDLDKEIYLIELIPIRYEIIDNKNRLISCGNAKIKEKIACDLRD